jgi:hypothetical protein
VADGAAGEIEVIEAEVLRADPESAPAGASDAHHAVRREGARIGGIVPIRGELTRRGIESRQPAVPRADPQRSRAVFDDAAHVVVRKGARVLRRVREVAQRPAGRIEHVQPARLRADPEPSAGIAVQGEHVEPRELAERTVGERDLAARAIEAVQAVVGADPETAPAVVGDAARRMRGLADGEVDERIGGGVVATQPRVRTDPHRVAGVRPHDVDAAVGDAVRVAAVGTIAVDRVAIVAIEPLVRPEPEEPTRVLEDGLDVGAGEPLVGSDLAEAQLLRTRKAPGHEPERQP